MEWREKQSDADLTTPRATVDTSALKLLETMKISHLREFPSLFTTFGLSNLSQSVGIASRNTNHSLSVMYPGTNKPPLILSKDHAARAAALFITISDQEYLADTAKDEIHIWNLERNTSSLAYKFQESGLRHLCVIDERTVASVAEQSSSGHHFSKIYILNTDTEKFNLNSTIRMTADGRITDICYVKTNDDTPCLLLSSPWNGYVYLLEMVGGRVRWQVNKQQMGGSFLPLSLCTDGNTVFVADPTPP